MPVLAQPQRIKNLPEPGVTPDRRRAQLWSSATQVDCEFVLENDPALIPVLVAHVQECLLDRLGCDGRSWVRTGVALEEALTNALYHGNLELDSSLRQEDGRAFQELARERRRQSPYAERRVRVRVRISGCEARFTISDQGPGFDPDSLPDPTAPENLTKASGRGLLLIRSFMDDVRHNARGNEITLIKRFVSG